MAAGGALVRKLAFVVGFVLLYGLIAVGWTLLPEGPTPEQQVRARLNRALPPGTPRTRGEAWLGAQPIKYFAYASVDDYWGLPETGVDRTTLGAVLRALVPDQNQRGLIGVAILFDTAGKLVKNVVREGVFEP